MKKNILFSLIFGLSAFLAGEARAQLVAGIEGGVTVYGFDGSTITIFDHSFGGEVANSYTYDNGVLFGVNNLGPGGSLNDGEISEYGLDGTAINPHLVTGINTPLFNIAASGNDLYTADIVGDRTVIGEYGTDGSTINASLLTLSAAPSDLVAYNGDLFFAGDDGVIGEYGLDGSVVNASLISGLPSHVQLGLAFYNNDIYVQVFADTGDQGKVSEYDMNGNPLNTSLITHLNQPDSIAINNGDIFIGGPGYIAEYGVSGNVINPAFVQLGADTEIVSMLLVVPEPSMPALMAIGAVVVFGLRRRLAVQK